MTTDYAQHFREAWAYAQSDGWERISRDTVYRWETRTTPEDIPAEWWPEPTYTAYELLTFEFTDTGRPITVHKTDEYPWTQATERKVSFKKALEILTSPRGENR